MSVTVDQWFNEPIIVLEPDAHVSQQELIDAWFRSVELAQTIPGTAYRIVDLRSTSAPDAVVVTLRDIAKALVGAPVDPILNVSFVGTANDPEVENWFDSLDDAVNSIRTTAGAPSASS
jgi:hypothetical protein